MIKHVFVFLSFLTIFVSAHSQPLDQIVAIVNNNIILKSDIDGQVRQFSQMQRIPFSQELWFDVLESVIDNYVLVEQAKIDSIIVSDEEVNRALDDRLNGQIAQFGSEEELERVYGKSVVQIKSEYRDQFREEIMAQRVRQSKVESIKITRPEVQQFFNEIPRDSIPRIPESVELSQIVVVAPPVADAKTKAYQLAETLRDSVLNHGVPFEDLAIRWSSDPMAKNGGKLPLMPMSDLVAEFSAAASALQPGGISEVVLTDFGYHVIRLNKRVGDQIETNHILIKLDSDLVDEEAAKEKLIAIRDSAMQKLASFGDLARRNSDDIMTAPRGGRVMNPQTGEKRLTLTDLDPSLYRIVLLLNEAGEISEPKPFNTDGPFTKKAFRIVKLDKLIEEHKANLDQDYEMIKGFALQRKQVQVLSEWIRSLREDIYVEYKIKVPTS